MEVWKQFDKNLVTHSAAHHLMAINRLLRKQGYARVSDVARFLEITRGSVSITVKKLKERDLIKEDKNRFLLLTDKGNQVAQSIAARHEVILALLTDVLGQDPEQADIDACKIEHLVSGLTCGYLQQLVLFFRFAGEDGESSLLEKFRAFQQSDTCQELLADAADEDSALQDLL